MYKWLTITGIVCIGFIIVLLSLGYLLKENEIATKALKQKLDQQKLAQQKLAEQKQLNSSVKNPSKAVLMFVDSDEDVKQKANLERVKGYKNTIISNITCAASEQCILVNTGLAELNCVVAVNTIGASLLKKELSKEFGSTLPMDDTCNETPRKLYSVCKQTMCQVESGIN